MADNGYMCMLLGLMIFCSLLKGTSCAEITHVFFSSGENVRLPCNNALSDCTSTTWLHSRHSETVELVAGGKLKNNIERRERLSVGSDCSLNIRKASNEDYGSYSCRQYVNEGHYGFDAGVYLHVMNGYQLMWVNQAGVNLMTDSRYQISDFSLSHCKINLTTTLLNEDHNREWRCQLTQNNQLKTSALFTVKYSDSNTTAAVTPENKTDMSQDSDEADMFEDSNTTAAVTPENEANMFKVIVAVAAVLAALAVVFAVFLVVFKKRAGNLRQAANTDARDLNQHTENYETINTAVKDDGAYETIPMSIPSAQNANEQKDDVTYSEVTSSNKGNKQVRLDNDRSNETVTYMTIRETECAPQDGLYATVKK